MMRFILLIMCLLLSTRAYSSQSTINQDTLAIIVNLNDSKSIEVSNYYATVRKIPEKNIIRVNLPTDTPRLSPEQFELLRNQIFNELPNHIQAILMVWTQPYAVGCNSITSAMTMGYDAALCKHTCNPSHQSDYFDSFSRAPFNDLGLRPSMLLPITSVENAKALIDRGQLTGFKRNSGTGYFLITSDEARNSRVPFYPETTFIESKKLALQTIKANAIQDKQDVMFYFTGLTHVPNLASLNFLPGAVGDHLTSFGGDLNGKGQMPSTRWLDAGATGSFGTVSEPCNYWQKFPNPVVLLKHYLQGETLIESYWKSVAWPAQGLFIGEPLATPY